MAATSNPAYDTAIRADGIRAAQVVIGCDLLEPNLSFFVQRLGFRVDAIFPADNPRTAMLSGHGLQLRLVQGAPGGATEILLLCDDPLAPGSGQTTLRAPNGVLVRLVQADPPMQVPATQQELVLTRAADSDHWVVGRAGLRYRDLVPQRHGGAFIASHIRVVEGGPVPDYVHFHKVRFQTIFCRRGWVRVVYEDQGAPFTMQAGDCVLQPSGIRHRVLESSAGAEVIEVSAPAEHITMADHDLPLPTAALRPGRAFAGQRFVRHVAAQATWAPWRIAGFEVCDTGIGAATGGIGGVRVLRVSGFPSGASQCHDTEFCFYFVLSGSLTLQLGDVAHRLSVDDSITLPGATAYAFTHTSADLTLLEVSLPAVFPSTIGPQNQTAARPAP